MAIAALAIPISVVYFASSRGRSFLASKGLLSTMPDALWFGLTLASSPRLFSLPSDISMGTQKGVKMPAWAWVIALSSYPI